MLLVPTIYLSHLSAPSDVAQAKVTFVSEFRTRFERRTDRDFDASNRDNGSFLFSRLRTGLTVSQDEWTARFQLQYTHTLNWLPGSNFSTDDSDFSQAYFQHKSGPTVWTIGRQKIVLGDQRLIGPLEWVNQARSFDGVRYQITGWDASFFGIAVQANRPKNARIGLVTHDHELGKTSYILKLDSAPAGDTTLHTLNHIWKQKQGSSNLEFEFAGQFGEAQGKDVGAFAAHAGYGMSINPRTSLNFEANIASGGQSSSYSRTFDNLYPTNHYFYGTADMVGWRNMQQLGVSAKYSPTSTCALTVGFHKFWLYDKTDGWYGAGGGINKRASGNFIDPTGAAGNDLGSEVDIDYTKNWGKHGTFSAGVSWFLPGKFVDNLTPGSARTQTWMYFSYGIRF